MTDLPDGAVVERFEARSAMVANSLFERMMMLCCLNPCRVKIMLDA